MSLLGQTGNEFVSLFVQNLDYENSNYFFFHSFIYFFHCRAQVKNKNENDTLGKRYSRIISFEQMDQRKIYHWANGQHCTPSGRNAGEHLPDYVKLIGNDSAVVVKDPKGELWNK